MEVPSPDSLELYMLSDSHQLLVTALWVVDINRLIEATIDVSVCLEPYHITVVFLAFILCDVFVLTHCRLSLSEVNYHFPHI